jgi:hypothetical protein
MQTVAALLIFALPAFAAVGCRAAEAGVASGAASQPAAGLTSAITISTDNGCTAEITISNPTDRALATGHYISYALVRTDTTPPTTVAASPANAMTPHFRVLMQSGESRTSKMTLSEKSLPAGHYELTITYPTSMFADPLQKEFDVSGAATTPN